MHRRGEGVVRLKDGEPRGWLRVRGSYRGARARSGGESLLSVHGNAFPHRPSPPPLPPCPRTEPGGGGSSQVQTGCENSFLYVTAIR